jgi:hypothetical protein
MTSNSACTHYTVAVIAAAIAAAAAALAPYNNNCDKGEPVSRCALLHWTDQPPAPAHSTAKWAPTLPHPPDVHVEISGWADIASMQEQVAHLPDAVRRDRWFDKYWTTAPSYLTILDHFFFFHF